MGKVNEVELASVRLLLQRALAEKGEDYVYVMPQVRMFDYEAGGSVLEEAGECQYLAAVFDENGTEKGLAPSCLWGHVLVWAGVDPVELHRREGDRVSVVPAPWTDSVIGKAADMSQRKQDSGGTWGEAVEVFELYLKNEAGA